jgi:N-acetylmuramoyl-L-alanine amidase
VPDSGTSTNDGYPEHTFNWDVVLKIQGALDALGVQTVLSTNNDDALVLASMNVPGPRMPSAQMPSSAFTPTVVHQQAEVFTSTIRVRR